MTIRWNVVTTLLVALLVGMALGSTLTDAVWAAVDPHNGAPHCTIEHTLTGETCWGEP